MYICKFMGKNTHRCQFSLKILIAAGALGCSRFSLDGAFDSPVIVAKGAVKYVQQMTLMLHATGTRSRFSTLTFSHVVSPSELIFGSVN